MELKIILDFNIHPVIVSDSHGTAQVTGLIEDDTAEIPSLEAIVKLGHEKKGARTEGLWSCERYQYYEIKSVDRIV